MASRPNWKGHLKLSLVSCPVALYNATTEREKVAFHMLNKETGNRLRRQMVDGETGEVVGSDESMRGYEVSKGEYVTFEDGELDDVALESTHTIDIDGFVPRSDVNDIYLDAPYFLVPNDKIGEEAFAVIRDAMDKRKMAGLARVVLYRRERVVMLEPHRKGIIATTLRYPYEIKNEDEFFGPIPDKQVPEEMLDLAEHIIDTKKKTFDPETFKDRYEDALKALIEAKRKGMKPRVASPDAAPSNVVDLMEALRRSVSGPAQGGAKARPAPKPRSSPSAPARKAATPARVGTTKPATAAKHRKAG